MTLLLLVNISAHLKKDTIQMTAVLQTPTWPSTHKESRMLSPGTHFISSPIGGTSTLVFLITLWKPGFVLFLAGHKTSSNPSASFSYLTTHSSRLFLGTSTDGWKLFTTPPTKPPFPESSSLFKHWFETAFSSAGSYMPTIMHMDVL
jgi:hypothetical protein